MPIRPENMAKYPGGSIRSPEWAEIRERIRRRAGDCCEECGVNNHALGGRLRDGTFLKAQPTGTNGMSLQWPREGEWSWCGGDQPVQLRIIRIVCTVAHVDGKLIDHSDANLRFWCQRCHNRHDARSRQENATITRHEKAEQHEYVRRKLLATGDRELVEDSWRDDYWGWGPDRDGQNMLGKLWMEVRAELRALDQPAEGREGE